LVGPADSFHPVEYWGAKRLVRSRWFGMDQLAAEAKNPNAYTNRSIF
jgi:hypothetical protein